MLTNYRFVAEPLGRPDVRDLVEEFKFDIFKKQLYIKLSENEALDGYRWIVSVKDLYDQANLYPNLKGKDQIVLHLYNEDKEFATLRFGRLLVEHHECNASYELNSQKAMLHSLVVSFERFEIDG